MKFYFAPSSRLEERESEGAKDKREDEAGAARFRSFLLARGVLRLRFRLRCAEPAGSAVTASRLRAWSWRLFCCGEG